MKPPLLIKMTRKMGRGVFANRNFKDAETIEVCPVIFIADLDQSRWKGTMLEDYVFGWGHNLAIVLGYGSLYNHSTDANVGQFRSLKDCIMTFYAKRAIKQGEQLFINYGWDESSYMGMQA
jgi:SET domain-containing protein